MFEEVVNGVVYYWESKACAQCPHRFECEKEELFWGCEHWEEEMEEDL